MSDRNERQDEALALLNLAHATADIWEAEQLMQKSLTIFREIGDEAGVEHCLDCIRDMMETRSGKTAIDCPFCEKSLFLEDDTNGIYVCSHCENEFFYLA